MITRREQYETLNDERAKLNFKKLTHVETPKEYWSESWGDLHELRSKTTKGLQHILDVADAEKRDLSDEENSAYKFGDELLDALNSEFEIRSERNTKSPVDLSNKLYRPSGQMISDGRNGTRFIPDGSKTGSGREFRNLFYPVNPNVELNDDGFNNLGEFFQAVVSQKRDERLKEAPIEGRTNVIGTGVSGGFAVPAAFTEILLDKALLADEIFRPRALVLPMEGPSVAAPMFDTEDRTGGDLFGLSLEFYPENSDMDIQSAKLRLNNLIAKKAAIVWEESRELVQDSPAFNTRLTSMLPRVVAAGLDRAFYTGNGVGRPLGLVNANSTITVTRNTANVILYADIIGLWGKLHPQCHRNSVWIINSASIPQLLALIDAGSHSIWHPGMSGSVKDGVPQTLFGRPVLYCDAAPAVGSSGDIALCDLTSYIVGLRQDSMIESSTGPGFVRDVVTFKFTIRIDGFPMWSKPLKMEDGSELSWAAILS